MSTVLEAFKRLTRPTRLRLKRARYALRLMLPGLFGASSAHRGGRILAVWDFRILPLSVGDFLAFHVVSHILRDLHHADRVDIAMVCDPRDPAREGQGLTADNFHHYFMRLLPVAFVNEHLGSLLIFDRAEALVDYMSHNEDRYVVFPPYRDPSGAKVGDYMDYFNYLLTFHKSSGYIPKLRPHPATRLWAAAFYRDHVLPKYPVVIHLRNSGYSQVRNADRQCWYDFLTYCQGRYDVVFVMIGYGEDIDPAFRRLDNVLISKSFNANLEQDLALIESCLFYLGMASGPAAMALFGETPHVIYRMVRGHESLLEPGLERAPWQHRLQTLVWENESTERLIHDFERLYLEVDRAGWLERTQQAAKLAGEKLAKILEPW